MVRLPILVNTFVHHDITSAVKITLDIQRSLHSYDWGSTVIDDMYTQMIMDLYDLERDSLGLSLGLSSPPKRKGAGKHFDNRKVWNGLRVRIGIAYGCCNCQKDPVTGGYDYYGTPVNTAARVEAAGEGGQTLITRLGYDALVHAHLSKARDDNKTHLLPASIQTETLENNLDVGNPALHRAVYLKGLKEPVDLFELVPVGFESRPLFFKSLKEFDKELREDGGQDNGEEKSARLSIVLDKFTIGGDITSLSYEDIMMRLVNFVLKTIEFEKEPDARFPHEVLVSHERMKAILSLHSPEKRREIVEELLSKWHLSVPMVSEKITKVVGEDTPGLLMISVWSATIVMVQQKKSILNAGSVCGRMSVSTT